MSELKTTNVLRSGPLFKMSIKSTDLTESQKSNIKPGILKLPEGVNVKGDLIAFGEDANYLHCITTYGSYHGVFKSEDKDHLYQYLLKLNQAT